MNTKTRNTVLTLALVVLVGAMAWATASNFVKEGDVVTLTWSVTSPAANSPCVKCTSKDTGGIIGVSLNGLGTAGENVSVATKGVFDVPVLASGSNIAIGDFIYGTLDGINTGTTTLSNASDGHLLFGQALEAATASTTAQTINVLLRQPGQL